MKKFWILDREDSPQGLPLCGLLRTLRTSAGLASEQVRIRRSRGYGESVCAWDNSLNETSEVEVPLSVLEALADSGQEWFYDLDIECLTKSGPLRFGVHDSSTLFVAGPVEVLINVIGVFASVREALSGEV
jgi:hypothetical protein